MVFVSKAYCALFIFIVMTLTGCQSNVELPAQLVAVVDNYPPNYNPDGSHIEYSRKINVVFKIKNVISPELKTIGNYIYYVIFFFLCLFFLINGVCCG